MKYKQFKLRKKYKPIIEEWIETLRSGEYEQGHTELYTKALNTYCCLGVYCSALLDLDEYLRRDGTEGCITTDSGMVDIGSPNFIPDLIGETPLTTYLTTLNDGWENIKPHSFKEIADYLETHIKYV